MKGKNQDCCVVKNIVNLNKRDILFNWEKKWRIKTQINWRDFLNNEEVIKRRVAREILSMIETVCFSEEFKEYRVNYGSNGERDLIIKNIKESYCIE